MVQELNLQVEVTWSSSANGLAVIAVAGIDGAQIGGLDVEVVVEPPAPLGARMLVPGVGAKGDVEAGFAYEMLSQVRWNHSKTFYGHR